MNNPVQAEGVARGKNVVLKLSAPQVRNYAILLMFNPYGVARRLVFVLPRPALRLVRVIHIAHLRRAKGKNILMILP